MEAKHRVFKTVVWTGSASLRAEKFPRRLCRACCYRTRTSLISMTSSSWACESRRSAQPCGSTCRAGIAPLAAKEARLPHVSVACGDVLRMRDKACVVRACRGNGSLLFIVQELRFDPCMQLAAFVSLFFFLNHMCSCKLYACCMHAALQLARRGGHSAPT